MKTCNKCGEVKPLEGFHRRGSKHQAWCKACRKTYDRSYHKEYLPRRREVASTRHESRREWLWGKKDRPCMDCGGEFHPVSMQFDHRPDEEKDHNIGTMVGSGFSLTRIEQEIEKCDLVCANCHSVRTWERFGKEYTPRRTEQGFEVGCNPT